MIVPSIAAALFLITGTAAVQGWEGLSFGRLYSCERRVQVATPHGDSILVWPDEDYPPAGEDLRGNFQTIGETTIYRADGRAVRVCVEATGLTTGQTMDRERQCHMADVRRSQQRLRRPQSR